MKRFCLALAVLALSAPAAFAEVKATSPDGKVTDNGTQKAILSVKAHAADVTGLAYSPDGKTLGSVDKDGVLNLFDASMGKVILTIKAGIGGSLSFSPNGKTVAVAGDKKTKKFDVATGKETQ